MNEVFEIDQGSATMYVTSNKLLPILYKSKHILNNEDVVDFNVQFNLLSLNKRDMFEFIEFLETVAQDMDHDYGDSPPF
jgi:hypothetical protein